MSLSVPVVEPEQLQHVEPDLDDNSSDTMDTHRILAAINAHRRRHGAVDLQWDPTCAAAAQHWANCGQFLRDPDGRFGENLAVSDTSYDVTYECINAINVWQVRNCVPVYSDWRSSFACLRVLRVDYVCTGYICVAAVLFCCDENEKMRYTSTRTFVLVRAYLLRTRGVIIGALLRSERLNGHYSKMRAAVHQ